MLPRRNLIKKKRLKRKKKTEFGFIEPESPRSGGTKLPSIPHVSSRAQEGGGGGGEEGGDSAGDDEDKVIQALPDRDRAEVSQAITYFGLPVVKKVYSKKWQKRKEGLEELQTAMSNTPATDKDKAAYQLQPALRIIHRGLRDKVFGVFSTALRVLEFLIHDYLPKHKLEKTRGGVVADRTHYILITRTGDTVSDSRFRSESIDFLLNTVKNADHSVARAYSINIIRPFEVTGFSKIDQGHTEIAERIVEEMNAPNEKLSLDEQRVCAFAMSAIQHTDPEVRQGGARILIHMYKHGDKETVRAFLPEDESAAALKNPLFKALFDEIDKIDGKKPRSTAAAKSAAGDENRAIEEQVAELRRQNAELKNTLTRGGTEKSIKPKRRAKSRASTRAQSRADNDISRVKNRSSEKRRNSIGAASPGELSQIRKSTGKPLAANNPNSKLPRPTTKASVRPKTTALKPGVPGGKSPSLSGLQAGLSRSATERSLKSNVSNASSRKARSRRPKTAAAADPFEKMCMFCGEKNKNFTEKGLDDHYLRNCPMLKKCTYCNEMIEISTLKDHYLTECTDMDKFKECPRCKEPLLPDIFDKHQKELSCTIAKPAQVAARCVLCHKDVFNPSDEAWRTHLIGPSGCSGNKRRMMGIGARM